MKRLLLVIVCLSTNFLNILAKVDDTHQKTSKVLTLEETKELGLQALDLDNGRFFMPKHDGIHYFIETEHKPSTDYDRVTVYEIDKAIENTKKPIHLNKDQELSGSFLNDALANLPATFILKNGNAPYSDKPVSLYLTIFEVTFTPTGLQLSAGVKFLWPFTLNNPNRNQRVYLGSKNIHIPYQGGFFKSTLPLIDAPESLISTHDITHFTLGEKTTVSFDNGKFEKIALNGEVSLSASVLVMEDENGNPRKFKNVKFFFETEIGTEGRFWDNMYLGLKPKNAKNFHFKNAPDFSIKIPDDDINPAKPNIVLDLNPDRNPLGITSLIAQNRQKTEKCNCFTGQENGAWNGLYINNFAIKLPEKFIKKQDENGQNSAIWIEANGLSIGKYGIYLNILHEEKSNKIRGKLGNDLDFKMEKFNLVICKGSIETIEISGTAQTAATNKGNNLPFRLYREKGILDYNFSLGDDKTDYGIVATLARKNGEQTHIETKISSAKRADVQEQHSQNHTLTKPMAPQFSKKIVTDSSIVFQWRDSESKNVVAYRLFRSMPPDTTRTLLKVFNTNTPLIYQDKTAQTIDQTTIQSKWLENNANAIYQGNVYEYTFLAYDNNNLQSNSEDCIVRAKIDFQTSTDPIDNLSAKADSSTVFLSWDYPEKQMVRYVELQRRGGGKHQYFYIGNGDYTFKDENLLSDTEYSYQIAIYLQDIETILSEEVRIKTLKTP